jgi:transcriptional regulator with XRE-family HTH domain
MPQATPERTLGARIRQLRALSHLSQEALADRASIHRTYLSALERGEQSPTVTVLVRLAAALEVQPSALISVLDSAAGEDP